VNGYLREIHTFVCAYWEFSYLLEVVDQTDSLLGGDLYGCMFSDFKIEEIAAVKLEKSGWRRRRREDMP